MSVQTILSRQTKRFGLVGGVVIAAAVVVALSFHPATRSGASAVEVATAQTIASAEVKAKSDDEEARNNKTGKARGPLPTFTPEREAAALTFVAAHHPELSPLLGHLKKGRPNEYQKAIRKLFNDSERLAHSRENQPKRYELELKDWKLGSRIELLVAKMTMDRTPALEAELRKALAEQLDNRRALLVVERDRAAQRVEAVDRELADLDANRDARIEEKFEKALSAFGSKKQK